MVKRCVSTCHGPLQHYLGVCRTVHPTSKVLRKLEWYRVQSRNTNHRITTFCALFPAFGISYVSAILPDMKLVTMPVHTPTTWTHLNLTRSLTLSTRRGWSMLKMSVTWSPVHKFTHQQNNTRMNLNAAYSKASNTAVKTCLQRKKKNMSIFHFIQVSVENVAKFRHLATTTTNEHLVVNCALDC